MAERQVDSLGPVEQPRYLKLVRALRSDIDSGGLRVGDRLPGEREICRRFSVSRTTVRRALSDLHADGYVQPDGTRGWFVTALVEPNVLFGFTDLAAQRGLDATSRVLKARLRPATFTEGGRLGVPPSADVFELERVRLLGGVPVGWQRAVIAAWLAPGVETHDYVAESVYEVMRSLGNRPMRADYDVQASVTDATRSRLLRVERGSPVLLIHATTYDQQGRPLELSDGAFLGDRYRFTASVIALPDPGDGAR